MNHLNWQVLREEESETHSPFKRRRGRRRRRGRKEKEERSHSRDAKVPNRVERERKLEKWSWLTLCSLSRGVSCRWWSRKVPISSDQWMKWRKHVTHSVYSFHTAQSHRSWRRRRRRSRRRRSRWRWMGQTRVTSALNASASGQRHLV